jgi:hypothetical protein
LLGCGSENGSDTALFSIDVIQVPLAAPEKARIVNRPRIFRIRERAPCPACGRVAITDRARSGPP